MLAMSFPIDWLVLGLTLLVWVMLIQEGTQKTFGQVTPRTQRWFVLTYVGFALSQLPIVIWITVQTLDKLLKISF